MRRGGGEGEVQGGIKGVGRAGGLSEDRIGFGSCLPVLLVGHRQPRSAPACEFGLPPSMVLGDA
jgi:hypothetical protein